MNIPLSHPRALRPLRKLAAACTVAILLSGCQSTGTGVLVSSTAPPEISGPAASTIAGDMVSRLAEQIGPGKATVALKTDTSPFGQAMEAALKGWGYAVITDQKTDSGATVIPLTYAILDVDGQVLARLSTNSVELGRAYSVTVSGATPASALSLMRRG
ncbi:conjugal transfer protein TrbH [Rhizobium skierniewicense]|uniref:conjugal transfer protein TrbH n=1 Tax=Rhizobium skierniewicense TaxID=984260 RepID=UPI001FAD7BAC|nr:conjugal transfer protein TrbH [Rhizobium skierniewicense]MCI9868619.1 conjugal transfer protein TrbH [Rhizobium skierniewicense]